ncbi:hypothetical protein EC968_008635 [Mortierella alpina]|nr:hypothetical protein EC968_008635 [Mortierella alpina]
MTVRGSSTTSMGSIYAGPPQDRQDPVTFSLPISEQPLLSTTTTTTTTTPVTTRGPIIRALCSGAPSHQEERSSFTDIPRSSMIMIPIPSSSEQPPADNNDDDDNDNDNDNDNDDDDNEPLRPSTTTTATATATAMAATVLLETHLRELRSRLRHLNLLKAGMFFLLPSVLPYLVSVSTFKGVTTASFTTEKGGEGEGEGGFLLFLWMAVPWIPLAGSMVPGVLATSMMKIQDYRNKRQSLEPLPNNQKTMMTMTTTATIMAPTAGQQQQQQRTRCPYERLRRLFGGSRWAAAPSGDAAPSGPSPMAEEAGEGKIDENDDDDDDDEGCNTGLDLCHLKTTTGLHPRLDKNRNRRLLFPRSRTILMVSLCAWILLLASAPHLGLNQVETLVYVVGMDEGSNSDLILQKNRMVEKEQKEKEEKAPFATILHSPSSKSPMVRPQQSWEDENQTKLEQQEQEHLEVMVRAAEEDEVVDWERLYPDPDIDDPWDDPSALRDFWGTPEEMEVDVEEEEYQPQPQQQQQQRQEQEQEQQPEESVIRLFKYIPFTTEVFMFLLSLCLGSMAVGIDLFRSRTQHSQSEREQELENELVNSHQFENSEEARAYVLETIRNDDKQQGHVAWIWACGTMSTVALGLSLWLAISPRQWNIPSMYFVGMGCAGLLLVHAWVPENDEDNDHVIAKPGSAIEHSRSSFYHDNEKGLSF